MCAKEEVEDVDETQNILRGRYLVKRFMGHRKMMEIKRQISWLDENLHIFSACYNFSCGKLKVL